MQATSVSLYNSFILQIIWLSRFCGKTCSWMIKRKVLMVSLVHWATCCVFFMVYMLRGYWICQNGRDEAATSPCNQQQGWAHIPRRHTQSTSTYYTYAYTHGHRENKDGIVAVLHIWGSVQSCVPGMCGRACVRGRNGSKGGWRKSLNNQSVVSLQDW